MLLIYIAGPFRAETHWQIHRNIFFAEHASLEIAQTGYAWPVCPHKNTENLQGEVIDNMALAGTMEMMRRCDALYLIRGWKNSAGSRAEHDEAIALNIPCHESMDAVRAWIATAWSERQSVCRDEKMRST